MFPAGDAGRGSTVVDGAAAAGLSDADRYTVVTSRKAWPSTGVCFSVSVSVAPAPQPVSVKMASALPIAERKYLKLILISRFVVGSYCATSLGHQMCNLCALCR